MHFVRMLCYAMLCAPIHTSSYRLNLYGYIHTSVCANVFLTVCVSQHIYLNIVFHAWNVLGINPFIRLMATSVEWNLIELPHDLLSIIYTRSLAYVQYRQILTPNNQTNSIQYLNHRKIRRFKRWKKKRETVNKKKINKSEKCSNESTTIAHNFSLYVVAKVWRIANCHLCIFTIIINFNKFISTHTLTQLFLLNIFTHRFIWSFFYYVCRLLPKFRWINTYITPWFTDSCAEVRVEGTFVQSHRWRYDRIAMQSSKFR